MAARRGGGVGSSPGVHERERNEEDGDDRGRHDERGGDPPHHETRPPGSMGDARLARSRAQPR